MKSEELLRGLLDEVENLALNSATLSSPSDKQAGAIVKVGIRPLQIKGKALYQVSSHDGQKVFHSNLTPLECRTFIENSFPRFHQGVFETASATYHVLVNKQKQMTVLKKAVSSRPLATTSHNVTKNYLLPEGNPISFLVELGIMSAQGKVIAKKYDKFRQINRFVELIDDVFDHFDNQETIEIIDFGCGKAYLTFALYYYLTVIKKRKVHITGLDLKQDVIETCQKLARKLDYHDLYFRRGDINQHETDQKIDLVISLHACDTATDAVLEKAVKWQAKVILSVPCCQHELLNQVQCDTLNSLLRYGILKERFSALVTDAARAELLISQNYQVQILEFIDMEHTPKNLLIRAVKSSPSSAAKQALERYTKMKSLLSIEPSLEKRLDRPKGPM